MEKQENVIVLMELMTGYNGLLIKKIMEINQYLFAVGLKVT